MSKRHLSTIFTNFAIILVLGILFVSTIYGTTEVAAVKTNDAVYSGNKDSDKLSLMINVYWGTEYIEKIMDVFDEYGFKTTFFVGGKWVEQNGELLKKMYDRGFEIANHGYLHRDASSINEEQNRQEIIITEKLIKSIIGYETKLFAPPSGDLSDAMFKVAKAEGYKVIMWTRDTIDWRDKNADLVYERAIKDAKSGDLVLMHPTAHTLEALPKILNALKEKNLKVDIVSNVIGSSQRTPKPNDCHSENLQLLNK